MFSISLQFRDDRLKQSGDRDRVVNPRRDVANTEFKRREQVMRATSHSNY